MSEEKGMGEEGGWRRGEGREAMKEWKCPQMTRAPKVFQNGAKIIKANERKTTRKMRERERERFWYCGTRQEQRKERRRKEGKFKRGKREKKYEEEKLGGRLFLVLILQSEHLWMSATTKERMQETGGKTTTMSFFPAVKHELKQRGNQKLRNRF